MKAASLPGSCAEDHLEELVAAVPPGCEGLMLQPYWSPGLKQPGPEARGAIIGFSDAHGRAHLLRAILEGLAYSLREGLERIERRTRVPITALRVAGGGSRSAAAMQLTADIFGRPATRPETREASGLGAAMIAAVSLGLHADFPAAVAAMTRAGDVFDPIPANRRHYDRIYRTLYLKMYRRLKPFYQRMQDLFA